MSNKQNDIIAEARQENMTTCEVADSVKAFNCQRYEQCDDCWLVDHLKECLGCEHVDHPIKEII